MDDDDDQQMDIITLQNAAATELVRTLNQMAQGADGTESGAAAVKMVADERTNSVLISGEKSLRLRLKAMVLELDTPQPGGGGGSNVVAAPVPPATPPTS
jgi:general secretion pathway protein D